MTVHAVRVSVESIAIVMPAGRVYGVFAQLQLPMVFTSPATTTW